MQFRPITDRDIDTDPIGLLAANVIARAIADAESGDRAAASWLDDQFGATWRKLRPKPAARQRVAVKGVDVSQTDNEQAIDRMAEAIKQAITDAELGNTEALQFLSDVMPDWRLRRPGILQPSATIREQTTMDAIDYDEPLPELDGLSRNDLARELGVDPRYILAAPTPETDARKRVADALNIDWRRIPSDVIISEGVVNV